MSCKICGEDTPYGKGNFSNRKNQYCSTGCIKKANYQKNKPTYTEANKKWAQDNPEKRAEHSEKYRRKNKVYYAAYRAKRRAQEMLATPKWADQQDLFNVYLEARHMGLEVDHIIPLVNPYVCGLHVWDNLQLLTRSQNARKSNKYDIDILAVIKETE